MNGVQRVRPRLCANQKAKSFSPAWPLRPCGASQGMLAMQIFRVFCLLKWVQAPQKIAHCISGSTRPHQARQQWDVQSRQSHFAQLPCRTGSTQPSRTGGVRFSCGARKVSGHVGREVPLCQCQRGHCPPSGSVVRGRCKSFIPIGRTQALGEHSDVVQLDQPNVTGAQIACRVHEQVAHQLCKTGVRVQTWFGTRGDQAGRDVDFAQRQWLRYSCVELDLYWIVLMLAEGAVGRSVRWFVCNVTKLDGANFVANGKYQTACFSNVGRASQQVYIAHWPFAFLVDFQTQQGRSLHGQQGQTAVLSFVIQTAEERAHLALTSAPLLALISQKILPNWRAHPLQSTSQKTANAVHNGCGHCGSPFEFAPVWGSSRGRGQLGSESGSRGLQSLVHRSERHNRISV